MSTQKIDGRCPISDTAYFFAFRKSAMAARFRG